MTHPTLNLPECLLRTRLSEKTGLEEVFDPQRKKWVRLTPEEWVRQNFVNYLINFKHFPQGRLSNEVAITLGNMSKRCDSVVYNREGRPLVICEYKAPTVQLTQKVFDQILRYDFALQVEYLVVSNGLRHYCCHLNKAQNRFEFLPELPDWSLLEQVGQ